MVTGLKEGSWVSWRSQACGRYKTKVGRVEEVVPANSEPRAVLRDAGHARPLESYVVDVDGRLYWPRASALATVDDSLVAHLEQAYQLRRGRT